MAQSILIPASVFPTVFKRLERLAKKAGVAFYTVPGTSVVYRKRAVRKGRIGHTYLGLEVDATQVLECHRVTVEELPATNGYEFIGKLAHTEFGNMICMAGAGQGMETPEEWRTAKPTCDHCATKRSRKDTFIIRTPEGEIKRIGRNCLADFLKTDPDQLVAVAEFEDSLRELEEADEDTFSGGSSHWAPSTFHFLCCAVASIRINGFFKRGEEKETAASAGWLAYSGNALQGNDDTRKLWRSMQPTEEDKARAVEVLTWLECNTDSSDYIHNLKIALQLPVVGRNGGVVASAPQAYNRHLGIIAEKKARESLPDVGFLGVPKERLDFTATVTGVRVVEAHSKWSDVMKITEFRTAEGHDCVTFGGDISQNDVGNTYRVRGTVTKHAVYKGRKQTTLNRCVFTALETETA